MPSRTDRQAERVLARIHAAIGHEISDSGALMVAQRFLARANRRRVVGAGMHH